MTTMRMTYPSVARRARSAAALCAGAALLSLAACGPEAEAPADPSVSASAGDAAEPSAPQVSPSAAHSSDDAATDEGGTSTTGDRTRIVLVTELGLDGIGGEGAPALAADELAALLADPFGGSAECSAELVLEPGATAVDCVGPRSIDSTEATQDWMANVVMVPSEAGFQNGSRVAVLFSTGTALPQEAEDLLGADISLTGVGVGSMFGAAPLSAEELAESTLGTLTSEHAYVPVDQMADWSDVTCEDGLDFTQFETVDCQATTADGTVWELQVAPGTYANNDQGLLVGIETSRNG